jgi:hypothetical protein
MALPSKVPVVLLLAVLHVSAAGCGKKSDTFSETDFGKTILQEIHDLYTGYIKNNQRPPHQLSDLKKYEAINPIGYNALKDGRYVAVWGLNTKDGGTVLAYPKDAPTQGGAVLMADGSVKNMSADELQAALKTKK